MSYKPSENDLMAYLYGELENSEREAIEKYLFKHPEARLELERLSNVRTLLAEVTDKEVIAPPIFVDERRSRSLWDIPYIRTIGSIAASLLIVILAGRLAGMNASYDNREFRISFGGTKSYREGSDALSTEAVQAMINASLERNNQSMEASLKETQSLLDESVNKSLALNSDKIDKLVREASVASQDQVREFVSGLQAENLQLVKNYFKLSADEQKEYIESMLVDFSKYLQQQRNDDLQLVQTRLNSLEQNTDVFKQETEQILTSIISTVGNKNTVGAAY